MRQQANNPKFRAYLEALKKLKEMNKEQREKITKDDTPMAACSVSMMLSDLDRNDLSEDKDKGIIKITNSMGVSIGEIPPYLQTTILVDSDEPIIDEPVIKTGKEK